MPPQQFKAPMEQINSELFTLTYGSLVRQLLNDFDDVQQVNKQLEQMGFNIGTRLVDEFLARHRVTKCQNFQQSADMIAKQALPMFLNITGVVCDWDAGNTSCTIMFTENPFTDFVELPTQYQQYSALNYWGMLPGVITGAMSMLNMQVQVSTIKDMLRGAECYAMRLKLLSQKQETFPFKDDD